MTSPHNSAPIWQLVATTGYYYHIDQATRLGILTAFFGCCCCCYCCCSGSQWIALVALLFDAIAVSNDQTDDLAPDSLCEYRTAVSRTPAYSPKKSPSHHRRNLPPIPHIVTMTTTLTQTLTLSLMILILTPNTNPIALNHNWDEGLMSAVVVFSER